MRISDRVTLFKGTEFPLINQRKGYYIETVMFKSQNPLHAKLAGACLSDARGC